MPEQTIMTFTKNPIPAVAMVITCALSVTISVAQSSKPNSLQAQETQARGYWIDPATGLMWAGKDNGEDVSWKKAMKYCHNLRLNGYSDWRLANLNELQGIYDKNVESPGLMGAKFYHNVSPSTWHVKGGLYLTGNDWASTPIYDDRGKPSGYAWRFDFNEGREFDGDEKSFSMGKRALCVRTPSNDLTNIQTTSSTAH
jgi:Protein of unknown function (DUF1566)